MGETKLLNGLINLRFEMKGRKTARIFIVCLLLIAAVFSVMDYSSDHREWLLEVLRNLVMSFSIGGCVLLLLALGFSRKDVRLGFLPILWALILMWLGGAAGGAIGWMINDAFFGFQVSGSRLAYLNKMGILGILLGIGPLTVITLYQLWDESLAHLAEKESAMHRLAQLETKAKLEALRAKVNPHFLFNTLNSIAGLAAIDAARTERMILKLADLFRYTLNAGDRDWAPLKEELAVIQDYLDIEKVRLGKKLRFVISDDHNLGDMRIPSMLLQPIVENAVVHGIARLEEGGEIQILCKREDRHCRIQVINHGPPSMNHDPAEGFGILSVTERLRLIYGEDFSFELKPGRETKVTLMLPIQAPEIS